MRTPKSGVPICPGAFSFLGTSCLCTYYGHLIYFSTISRIGKSISTKILTFDLPSTFHSDFIAGDVGNCGIAFLFLVGTLIIFGMQMWMPFLEAECLKQKSATHI
jgi:hypothetical protein